MMDVKPNLSIIKRQYCLKPVVWFSCIKIIIKLVLVFKGALDNILKFSFWLNLIYHVESDC